MSRAAGLPLALRIATRYLRTGERSQLVSFMSMLTIGGLALGVTILISVLSVMNGFEREMRQTVLGIVPHATVYSTGGAAPGERERIVDTLRAHPAVQTVVPLVEEIAVASTDRSSKGVLAVGVDPAAEQTVSPIGQYMSGGGLDALRQERFQILLGRTLAEQLGVGTGDSLRLFSPDLSINPLAILPQQRAFTVAGVYQVGARELDAEMVILREDDARALFRRDAADTGMRLELQDVLAADRVAEDLSALLPAGWRLQVWTRQFGAVYDNILLSRTIVGFLLWLLVAVAAFNLVVSLIMIVRDKSADIAILRTMGASPRMIAQIFLLQGCMVGLIGTAVGTLAGVTLSLTLTDLYEWFERLSGTQLLSAEVYPVDFLPTRLMATDITVIAIGVLLLSLLASVYPALRASGLQPASALRQE